MPTTYTQQIKQRQVGGSEIVRLTGGHPWTFSVESDGGNYTSQALYHQSTSGTPPTLSDTGWFPFGPPRSTNVGIATVPSDVTYMVLNVTAVADGDPADKKGATLTLNTFTKSALGDRRFGGSGRIAPTIVAPDFMLQSEVIFRMDDVFVSGSAPGPVGANLTPVRDREIFNAWSSSGTDTPRAFGTFFGFLSPAPHARIPGVFSNGAPDASPAVGQTIGMDTSLGNNWNSGVSALWVGSKVDDSFGTIWSIWDSISDQISMDTETTNKFGFMRNDIGNLVDCPESFHGYALAVNAADGELLNAELSATAATTPLTGTKIIDLDTPAIAVWTGRTAGRQFTGGINELWLHNGVWTPDEIIKVRAYAESKFEIIPL